MRWLALATLFLMSLASIGSAAEMSASQAHLAKAAEKSKTTYIMFYRQNDSASQAMHKAVKAHCDRSEGKATWVNISISDASENELIQKYDATRSPMPMVVSVAPNGAVAGVFPLKIDDKQLARTILTPQYADMVKALQEKKIVVTCLQPATGGYVPAGVKSFLTSAGFQNQTHLVNVNAGDPEEADFFARMRTPTSLSSPVVMVFAPPGVHVGTFDATVTGTALATKVHQSGSCNCEKCQKNR